MCVRLPPCFACLPLTSSPASYTTPSIYLSIRPSTYLFSLKSWQVCACALLDNASSSSVQAGAEVCFWKVQGHQFLQQLQRGGSHGATTQLHAAPGFPTAFPGGPPGLPPQGQFSPHGVPTVGPQPPPPMSPQQLLNRLQQQSASQQPPQPGVVHTAAITVITCWVHWHTCITQGISHLLLQQLGHISRLKVAITLKPASQRQFSWS